MSFKDDVSFSRCPFDLFSGDMERIKKALSALLEHGKHRHTRLLVNGQVAEPCDVSLSIVVNEHRRFQYDSSSNELLASSSKHSKTCF